MNARHWYGGGAQGIQNNEVGLRISGRGRGRVLCPWSPSLPFLGEEEISFPPTYRYERGSRDTYAWHKQKPTGVSENGLGPRRPPRTVVNQECVWGQASALTIPASMAP